MEKCQNVEKVVSPTFGDTEPVCSVSRGVATFVMPIRSFLKSSQPESSKNAISGEEELLTPPASQKDPPPGFHRTGVHGTID